MMTTHAAVETPARRTWVYAGGVAEVEAGQGAGEPPPEFDARFYHDRHPDLHGRTDDLLRAHYEAYGRKEGRAASPVVLRQTFLELVDLDRPVLEIGPFCSPCVRGGNVRYFEVLDQAALVKRAESLGMSNTEAPYVHYVEKSGDLSVVRVSFASVVSSHCLEHQPDLVYHLQQVERLLDPGGCYFVIVPNKLYCFDHFIAESTIAGIVSAHRHRHKVHRVESVIEHRALTTHNHPLRHWKGDHANPDYWSSIPSRANAALQEIAASNGRYIDVHAWQFTPPGFRRIMQNLVSMGLTSLRPIRVYDTPCGSNEFTAILQKPPLIVAKAPAGDSA
jgi:SAM-dependent methyltransferase